MGLHLDSKLSRWLSSRFAVVAIDTIQRIGGVAQSDSGVPDYRGWIGSLRSAVDTSRLWRVVEYLNGVPGGNEVLEFLVTRKIFYAALDRRVSANAHYIFRVNDRRGGNILIKTDRTLPDMALTLIHEVRHAWQHERIGLLMTGINVPPDAVFAINKIIEADAYLFSWRLMQQHARSTSDGVLLNTMSKNKARFPKVIDTYMRNGDMQSAFIKMISCINEDGAYDRDRYNALSEIICEVEPSFNPRGIQRKNINPNLTKKLVTAVVQAICYDGMKPENSKMYVKNVKAVVKAALKPTTIADKVEELSRTYSDHYTAQRKTAPV